MTQRLAQRAAHPFLRHPKTGEPLEAIGIRKSGSLIWPIIGAAEDNGTGSGGGSGEGGGQGGGDNGGNGQNGSEGGSGGGGSNDEGSNSGQGGNGSGDGNTGGNTGDTVSREEHEALHRRMVAADKRADEEANKRKALEDKDKSDAEKTAEALEESRNTVKAHEETISTLRLENAFLSANETTWHNADQALTLARSQGHLKDVVDDDGSVDKKALKAALKKFATENPHLVKSSTDEGEGQNGGNGSNGGGRGSSNGSSGGRVGAGQNTGKNGPNTPRLRKKYNY